MSFRDDEIRAEFEAASNIGREYFDANGYSFRRLGKLDRDDFAKLTERLRSLKWYRANIEYARALNRAWKAAHPDLCRAHKRKSIAHRMKVDRAGQLAMRSRRRKKWRAKNPEKVKASAKRTWERRRDRPEVKVAALARAKAHYAAVKTDPARIEALRAYKREWARRKAAARRAV